MHVEAVSCISVKINRGDGSNKVRIGSKTIYYPIGIYRCIVCNGIRIAGAR